MLVSNLDFDYSKAKFDMEELFSFASFPVTTTAMTYLAVFDWNGTLFDDTSANVKGHERRS